LTVFTVPLGAAIGAGYGTACAAAGLAHPTADADFERFLRDVDANVLTRALEKGVHVPLTECDNHTTGDPAGASPDAVIEIEKVEAGMA
jgi:hypothetical protein